MKLGQVMLVAMCVVVAGCGDDDGAAVIDAALAEGGMIDAARADGAVVVDGAAPDAAAPPAIVINEVYVTTTGGDGRRYVELRGPAGTPLTGLSLRLIRGNGTIAYMVEVTSVGAVIPADGLWVVGGALVSNVDQFYSNANWGLDSTQGSVQLLRAAGATVIVQDVVGYGPAVTPQPVNVPGPTVEGAVAVPVPGQDTDSIGRRAGAADTNVNSNDFCRMTASPGAANGACL